MVNAPRNPRVSILSVLVAACLSLTACGGDASPGDASGASGTSGTSAGVLDSAVKAVESGYAGAYTKPPSSGPRPAKDKHIWVITAWQQVRALAYQAEQLSAAAGVLGWKAKVCDGLNNANGGMATCVRQATAAGASGIVLVSVDCAPVRQALVEARKAGVKIASFSGFDCDDPTQDGSSPLFDAPASYSAEMPELADFYTRLGAMRADLAIAKTGGEAKVLHIAFHGIAFGDYVAKGFIDRIAACGGCEIVGTVKVAPADVPNLRQKFETALVQASQANVVAVDVDHFFVAGIQPALVSSPRKDLVVIGNECQIDNLDYIRGGRGQQYCLGASNAYRAYTTIDALNRVFNGERVVPGGVGIQIVDKDHNLPAAGTEYVGPVDFAALYAGTWKGSPR
ncbi:substrate-binding domain-containing protein [Spongiactinospora sp. TRM90649]|uniref:sugar ABC transporter substrate-binding protein n=1 Tax=Spongiactinospora sp. TRM90649 TaxID=3031114 RepID=UPI0023F7F6E1|nr:substrate-binding domain-containing protein [Spongiactinospora sp. TRM90649]MDF5755123.1 substrate-binding domain-containing protein [Spongiactinospora sp. TRM90649]